MKKIAANTVEIRFLKIFLLFCIAKTLHIYITYCDYIYIYMLTQTLKTSFLKSEMF